MNFCRSPYKVTEYLLNQSKKRRNLVKHVVYDIERKIQTYTFTNIMEEILCISFLRMY